MPLQSRRRLLQTACGGFATGSLALLPGFRGLLAQAASATVQDLGFELYVLTLGGTNAVAAIDRNGATLVDGVAASHSDALLETLGRVTGSASVHTLFNTHWHPEQTGSNEALRDAGAKIVAHENTKLWLSTDVTWPWSSDTVLRLPGSARPTDTFYDRGSLHEGGLVEFGHLRDCPHTDGDIYVFFREQNVLAVGDAVSGDGWPMIDWWTGGWIGGLVGGLEVLLSVADPDTRVVPARGRVLTYDDLQAQHEMYAVIWERLARMLYGGSGTTDAVAARPTKEFDDTMGDPDPFVRQAFQSLWAYLSPDA